MASFLTLNRSRWLLLGAFLLCALWVAADWYTALPAIATAHYVGRQSCAECHATQVNQWHGSHHDRAMEMANEVSVLGDFNDSSFTYFGVTTRFFRRDDKYLVNTEGPDGKFRDYEVAYTFGIEPLQQYMVELPDGRVQVLRVSWDTVQKKWFYVTPPDVTDQRIEPGDPLHWTGIGQNWNTMCAECHSTDVHKNFDLETNTYQTTFAEIDVSCETCHGPASIHLELATSHSLFWDRRHGYGLSKLKEATAIKQIETCAPCHSRRSQVHPDYHAGMPFLDHYDPALLREDLYHPDGQILDEVYVYGSFLQSKMHAKGVRCTDCHNPHSLELKFKGNQLCTQCHQPGKYDSPTHHHHTERAATQCVNCHMPSKNYMVVDGRRDHSFRIPRPDLSEQLGTPNACNSCHTKPEESSAWAAHAVREWYGEKRRDDPHYGVAIAAARRGEAEGLDLLEQLLQRRDLPEIVRATAVELLANYPSKTGNRLSRQAIGDASPLVRAAAVRVLSPTVLERFSGQVVSMLEDPLRLVRMSTARRLAGQARRLVESSFRDAYDRALAEYRGAQKLMEERAAAQLNLAALSHALGNRRATQNSLQTALRLEPYLSGVRDKLAALLEQAQGNPAEIRKLRSEEIDLLERNYELLPQDASLRYRRGMLLYLTGQLDDAQKALQAACDLGPEVYENWLALALLCEKQQRPQQTINALKQMNRLRPGDAAARDIFERVQKAATASAKDSGNNG